jgi:hypothetical protein
VLDTIKADELDVEDLTASDYERVGELMRTYADLESASLTAPSWQSQSALASRNSRRLTIVTLARCGPITSKRWSYCQTESPIKRL